MLAGIKPTVGRISRYGVIPITADQDTAGPMAKNVTDAAIMLGALEGASPDPNDAGDHGVHAAAGSRLHAVPEGRRAEGRAHRHPARRSIYDNGHRSPATTRRRAAASTRTRRKAMADAIAVLKAQGAVIVDPGRHPERRRQGSDEQLPAWDICSGADDGKGRTTTARSSSSTA